MDVADIRKLIDNDKIENAEQDLYYGLIYAILTKNDYYSNIRELAQKAAERYKDKDIKNVCLKWAWECLKELSEGYTFTSIYHFFDVIELHIKKQKEYNEFYATELYEVLQDIEAWEWD